SFIPLTALAYAVDRGIFLSGAYFVLGPTVYFLFFRKNPFERKFIFFVLFGAAAAVLVLAFAFRSGFFDFFKYVFGVMPFYKGLSEKIPMPIHQWKFTFIVSLMAA